MRTLLNHDGTKHTKAWRKLPMLAIACAALVSIQSRHAIAEIPQEIRVVTYNIHHGAGLDNKIDLQRIAKLLKAENPDIVALQEVDQGTRRTNRVDQPGELAKLMGMEAVFGHNIDYDGGGYGTAVLTRLPIRSKQSVKLKSFYESTPQHQEQRGVQVLELGEKDGPGLLFLCTHLDYRPKDDERMASAKTINELIQKHGEKPALIAGDFNATPGSAPIREFSKQWKIAGWDGADAKGILTFPADKPDRRIDYVMYRPANRWQVVETRVLDEPVASDHRPVLTVLRRLDKK